jgi:DnaJ-class molecular chaperone
MNNLDNHDDLTMCIACFGAKDIYDGLNDTFKPCETCNGTGEATREENEAYLSTINYN